MPFTPSISNKTFIIPLVRSLTCSCGVFAILSPEMPPARLQTNVRRLPSLWASTNKHSVSLLHREAASDATYGWALPQSSHHET